MFEFIICSIIVIVVMNLLAIVFFDLSVKDCLDGMKEFLDVVEEVLSGLADYFTNLVNCKNDKNNDGAY